MKWEILIQNVFNFLIIAIVIEMSIMAIFSMTALKEMGNSRPVQMARDTIVVLLALVLCYKVDILSLFLGTGVKLHQILDTVISALVLTRLTNLVRDFFSKFKTG